MMMSSEQDEFYVTLPSNAGSDIFENKTSSYTTKLCQPIHLTGNWVVGLSSVYIPWSFYNIRKEEQVVVHIQGKKEMRYEVNFYPGYYDSILRIVSSLPLITKRTKANQGKTLLEDLQLDQILQVTFDNKNIQAESEDTSIVIEKEEHREENDTFSFHYDEYKNQVFIKYKRDHRKQYVVGMSAGLQNLLGFNNNPHVEVAGVYFQPKTEKRKPILMNVSAPFQCNLDYNIPSEMNVCVDIVKDQPIVGKLLRKISIHQYQYGKMHSFIFNRPHYVKVEKKYFDTLHVDLKDERGENLPFQFGTSNITLHFKRKK